MQSNSSFGIKSEHNLQMRELGYSTHNNYNTLGIFHSTEIYNTHDTPSVASSETTHASQCELELNQKYRGLVRQLPSRIHIDILLRTFFSDVNWQYDLIDEDSLRQQVDEWGTVSYADLQRGPYHLSLETRVLPGLLFQVLAQALLYQPAENEILGSLIDTLGSLIDTAGMSFHDLAIEYSDMGSMTLVLLGKKNITTATVQAGLLRASFLKSNGKVVDAWHVLGSTIRDAQEIGLHTGRVADWPHERSDIRAQISQTSDLCHRLWMVIHLWDIHMAVVLGRPIATNPQMDMLTFPSDDNDRRKGIFSNWRTETDTPRPFDVILAGYNVAYKYWPKIHQIVNNGARPEDYPTVEEIHAAVLQNIQDLPSWCRLENPNQKFDQVPGCQWLPAARAGLSSLVHLVLLTLHRPYIFSFTKSRTEALKAGFIILHIQEQMFQHSEPWHHKVFTPVYASFDAMVLIAAIYIAYPHQNREYLEEAIQRLERGMQRLRIMEQYNLIAKAVLGVVRALFHRFRYRLGTSMATGEPSTYTNSLGPVSSEYQSLADSSHFSNTLPLDLSFDTITPPHPVHDFFYDNFSSNQALAVDASEVLLPDLAVPDLVVDGLNFEGTHPDTSFWNVMNELNH